MAVSQISVVLPAKVEQVWSVVTNLDDWDWRSDIREIRVLGGQQFVEITPEGFSTTFTVAEESPCRLWAFDMENDRMAGRWTGVFTPRGDETEITFTEDVRAKSFWLRPFVRGYLKKQQARYVADLQKALTRYK